MNNTAYQKYLENKHFEYDNLCKHCGACCGANDGDPCENLLKNEKGLYYCKVYANRLGLQKTVSGKIFTCVPIKEIIKFGAEYPGCTYR